MSKETVNIFEIPLYYIAFKENKNIEKHYHDYGFKNVTHFEAVDGRKLSPDDLLKDGIITIRAYDDLKSGRNEHAGMSSLGAIGCALSHYRLLRRCIRKNMPYIIIVEEDNVMMPLSQNTINVITTHLKKEKSLFNSVSPSKEEHRIQFVGTNFYIASQGACQEMLKSFFPINAQIDWFMANKATTKDIDFKGFKISKQSVHKSTIQDRCIKCMLPKSPIFYICFLLFVIILIAFIIYKVKTCR